MLPAHALKKYTNCDKIHTTNYSKCPVLIAKQQARKPLRPNVYTFPAYNTNNFPSQYLTQSCSNPDIQLNSTTAHNHSTPSFVAATAGKINNPHPDMVQIDKQHKELTANLIKSGGNVKQTLITLI